MIIVKYFNIFIKKKKKKIIVDSLPNTQGDYYYIIDICINLFFFPFKFVVIIEGEWGEYGESYYLGWDGDRDGFREWG